jgi:hypothetical protein
MPEATEIVIVEVPEPVIEVGLKVTVNPAGVPDADNDDSEQQPFTVTVLVAVPPGAIVKEDGEAETEDESPSSASMRAGVGLPQPVTRSYPGTAA